MQIEAGEWIYELVTLINCQKQLCKMKRAPPNTSISTFKTLRLFLFGITLNCIDFQNSIDRGREDHDATVTIDPGAGVLLQPLHSVLHALGGHEKSMVFQLVAGWNGIHVLILGPAEAVLSVIAIIVHLIGIRYMLRPHLNSLIYILKGVLGFLKWYK